MDKHLQSVTDLANRVSIYLNSPGIPVTSPIDLSQGKTCALDLSAGAFGLGAGDHFSRLPEFTAKINELLRAKGAEFGIGGYGELRSLYTTVDFSERTASGRRYRTVHLGLDVWGAAGTPVRAPLDGHVYKVFHDKTTGGYGPALILQHALPSGENFYTLYGHLSNNDLDNIPALTRVRRGDKMATLGEPEENGGWPPHLHVQVIADLLGLGENFPGVAYREDAQRYLAVCPDPSLLFQLT